LPKVSASAIWLLNEVNKTISAFDGANQEIAPVFAVDEALNVQDSVTLLPVNRDCAGFAFFTYFILAFKNTGGG